MLTAKRSNAVKIFLFLAMISSLAMITACMQDDTFDQKTPIGLGEDITDPDPPGVAGTLRVEPAGSVTLGKGDWVYLRALGGLPRYYWNNVSSIVGTLTPIDEYGDGTFRAAKYKGNRAGSDIIILRDTWGNEDAVQVTVTD